MTESRRIARVLLDSPLPQLDRLFDYALPTELGEVPLGVRVRVPLRTAGRVVDGYVIELDTEDDADRPLSEVDSVVSTVPVLPSRLYRLARRAADRAAGSASDVLRLVIPKRQVRVEKAWTADAPVPVPTDAQQAAAARVIDEYDGLTAVLDESGRAAVEAVPVSREGVQGWAALLAAAAVHTLAAGRSSVLVVPDHRDLDRLLAALEVLAPAEAVVRHDSRLTNPDRYRSFLRTLEDAPCIVVGNRSAVYAPVQAGLVAVWDDGDPLLGEPLAPYINARDAALLRQEQEDSALVYAGHTRTTDVERLVAHGYLHDVRATRRVLPRVVLSTPQEMDAPTAQRMPSSAFLSARNAAADGPVLVQVSRPGFSPSLVCADCRAPARCAHCGGPLGATHRGAVPVCAWCGRGARAWACPACSSTKLRLASSGSERTADELGKAFPGIRVIVADSAHPVEHVADKPSLIVATRGAEPLAEGGYRAVVLLDGPRMLQAPDLRIGEACLRWWSNAAALAAPGAPIHLVGVDGGIARALATWNHSGFARAELAERAPLHMPPAARVALVEGTVAAVARGLASLHDLALPPDAVLGPVPIESDDYPPRVRALVRFDYGAGQRVASTLRAAVVAEAVSARRGKGKSTRSALSVRLDILDPEL
ncbi:primosomal protein N' [Microbacterium foliorum]|uniref:primosomal protein N' family DNA-binding protein n=1 Tax=Microbacterium foliorum TaxID=104336 RepID=UPI001D593C73|nr:primosomal protein N' [Microbacterium foliorum]CAH0143417.1 putative primosomal protein N' [Microbacterium foliorum]CAH0158707.1 putative primosomal protein N' [Microbacterium foliorum]